MKSGVDVFNGYGATGKCLADFICSTKIELMYPEETYLGEIYKGLK